jgi:hypothetical protein
MTQNILTEVKHWEVDLEQFKIRKGLWRRNSLRRVPVEKTLRGFLDLLELLLESIYKEIKKFEDW